MFTAKFTLQNGLYSVRGCHQSKQNLFYAISSDYFESIVCLFNENSKQVV